MDVINVIPSSRKPQFPDQMDYEVFMPWQAFSQDPSGKRKVKLVVRQWLISPPAPMPTAVETATAMEKKMQDDRNEPELHSFMRLATTSKCAKS